jgi:tripartite-type tricarboxylate transporter receptor subunit TctC
MAEQRDPRLPDIPSIAELGYPRLAVLGTPRVLFAPPGTTAERQQVIREALQRIVQNPQFVAWMDETGNYLAVAGPAEVGATIDQYAEIYRQLRPAYQRAQRGAGNGS